MYLAISAKVSSSLQQHDTLSFAKLKETGIAERKKKKKIETTYAYMATKVVMKQELIAL